MCVFDFNPLAFVLCSDGFNFVIRRSSFSLRQNADVNLVRENSLNRFVRPLRYVAALESCFKLFTLGTIILHRRKHAHFVKAVGDFFNAHAVLVKRKYHFHRFGCGFIYHKSASIIR